MSRETFSKKRTTIYKTLFIQPIYLFNLPYESKLFIGALKATHKDFKNLYEGTSSNQSIT